MCNYPDPGIPLDPELEKLRAIGKLVAPFLVSWAALQLATARMNRLHQPVATSDERRKILDESMDDAQHLLRTLL